MRLSAIGRRLLRHWPACVATLAAAILLGWRLGQYPFWSDEAITGLYARSLLHHPLPYAWDGRNLYCFGQPGTLTDTMHATTYPMLQFYVVWPFFKLFGPTTAAGRTPSVLLGLATVPLTYLLALRLFGERRTAALAAFLLASSVAFLLFTRQCRYYALVMFFSVLVLLLYQRLALDRRGAMVAFVFAALLLFHSQFLIFYCFMGGLTLAFVVERPERRKAWAVLLAGAVLLLLTVPWMLLFTRPYGVQELPLSSASRLADSATLLAWFLRDCNRAAFFPALALPFVAVAALQRDGGRLRLVRPAVFLTVLMLTQIVLVSILGVQPTERERIRDADVRYVVNLLPLMCILLGFACARLWRLHPAAGSGLCALLVATNLLTLGAPRCYLYDYVYELTHPHRSSTQRVIEELGQLAAQDDLVLVAPEFQRAPLMFYLGDRLRFCGILPADESRIVPRNDAILPAYVYSGSVIPDWIVVFARRNIREDIRRRLQREEVSYREGVIPVFWQDQSRPELMWHRFRPWPPGSYGKDEQVFLYRREDEPEAVPGQAPAQR